LLPVTRAVEVAVTPTDRPEPTLPWQVVGAVALCILFILALDIGYFLMSRHQVAARGRLEETVAADHALDRVQALMVDAETGVRGYVLVGRKLMLQPYDSAKAQFAEALAAVNEKSSGDEKQKANFDVLRGLLADKWAILDASVARQNTVGVQIPAATESTPDIPGKIVMDAIRNQVAVMHEGESVRRARLTEAFHRATIYTATSVLFASFLAVFAIFMLYWALRRYFRMRLEAEKELRASEERYRILTDVSPQIIWMADLKGEMTFCNNQWSDYTGLTLEQTIAAGAASVVHPDDREEVITAWQTAISRDEPFEAEVRLRRGRDGAYRWHLSRARALHDAAGKTLAWLGAALDIDERKMIEIALDQFNVTLAEQVEERTNALEERTAQLKALNQHLIRVAESERTRLARELHDELGAHLSVAMMDLTMISRRLAATGMTDIEALAGRLSETLNSTTQISRRIISDLRPVMIRELGLAGALDVYCAQFEQTTNIHFERAFPDSLPPLVEEAGIAIFRIVQESLSNIVKYASASAVRLSMGLQNGFIELAIQDDGAGMSAGANAKKGTHGLLGIRERAAAFGGTLQLTKGLNGRGTGIIVTLALDEVAATSDSSTSGAMLMDSPSND
jgi:PAS domain S-box-containing protein